MTETNGETCPDCRRPRPLSGVAWEALSVLERNKFCAVLLEIRGSEDEALIDCLIVERDRLRSELAAAKQGRDTAKLDALLELHSLAETKKWVAVGDISKEAAWGKAFKLALIELKAKYATLEQSSIPSGRPPCILGFQHVFPDGLNRCARCNWSGEAIDLKE
jgi:hypothetical protein